MAKTAEDSDIGEVTGYVPTRHEVLQLVKCWYGRVLDNSWFFFIYGGTGGSEARLKAFTWRRVDRAAEAVGKEAVDRAIKEVRDEFKAKVNDARLWDIFENGTEEQWDAVLAGTWREWGEQDAAETLKRLDQLEREFPGDFIALVLGDYPGGRCRPVLICPGHPELSTVLRAADEFGIETDKSKLEALMVDQHLTGLGFLRATRQNGDWRFEFPNSEPGTFGRSFLEWVAAQIKKLLHAKTVKEPRPA